MRTTLKKPLVLAALAAALSASGCSEPYAKVLRVDAGGYHVRGDYIGSKRRVKVFVERLHAEPLRSGRGTIVLAKIVVLNERTTPVTFDFKESHMTLGAMGASPVESHTVRVEAGELRRISITFRSGAEFDTVSGGTIELDGISADETGAKPSFSIPFSVTNAVIEYDPEIGPG